MYKKVLENKFVDYFCFTASYIYFWQHIRNQIKLLTFCVGMWFRGIFPGSLIPVTTAVKTAGFSVVHTFTFN